jgi:hypothetical protein
MNRPNSLFRSQLDLELFLTGALTSIAQCRGIRRNCGGRRLILAEGEAPRRSGGRHVLVTRAQNDDGLESAKPNLQSMFKKPGSTTAEPQLWEMLRGRRADKRIKRGVTSRLAAVTEDGGRVQVGGSPPLGSMCHTC